jgi:polyhydroxybutyrate depolymerase
MKKIWTDWPTHVLGQQGALGLPKFFLAIAALALSLTGPAAAELQRRTIIIGEMSRDYLLYLPDQRSDGERGLPLVIVLHGGSTVADMIMHYTRFNDIAARENIAVAYPYGMNGWWNDGRFDGGRGESSADDVGFIRSLVADVAANAAPLDRSRVFATGISNGGFMSLRLACEAADLVAGIAAVSASMPVQLGARCRPAKPVPILVINGTADPMVPYVGGFAQTGNTIRGAIWSTDRTVAFWTQRNRCAARPVIELLPQVEASQDSHVIQMDYRGCAAAPVKLLRVEGGGHTWPGGPEYLPRSLLGTTNRDIDASAVIWSFFKAAVPEGEPTGAAGRRGPPATHPKATSASAGSGAF